MDESFAFYVASQAIVRRDRILRHPKEYYRGFIELDEGSRDGDPSIDTLSGVDDLLDTTPEIRLREHLRWISNNSGLLEGAWPAMLGEPLREPTRDEDTRLPLSLKLSQTTRFSYGETGVI
ncbi:unnamed protein product [Amoebophrya sp. A25]|nr:unnamed protein product [Amoebophrya sp. A25]|eukprot:GSA25T00013207001.1